MILAPLQLRDYWLESVSVRTNPAFEANRESDLEVDFMDVKSDVRLLKSDNLEQDGTVWMVFLAVSQSIPEGKNIPYEFSLEMCGIVVAHPSLTGEKLERAIQVNGPSMLFGSAREILRAATGRGPYAPVIIPSTNFFQRLPQKENPVGVESTTETEAPRNLPGPAAKPKAIAKKTPRKRK
jgi:preprotein translocase subunit SecB